MTVDRREFFRATSAAAAAALAGSSPRAVAVPAAPPRATADTCILLWMGGGMAAPDTFDPKRYTPYKVGTPAGDILSTFPAIDTAVDGLQISQGLERVAGVMDRGTLIRSHVVAELGNILHSRHQYHWHTGYVPPQTVAAPHLGAWVAKLKGPNNPAVPAFINVGQRLDLGGESEEIKAFTTAGFLGAEYGPFQVPDPLAAATAVRPPKGVTPARFEARQRFFREQVKRGPAGELAGDYHAESIVRSMENAYRLLGSKERAAFDLSLESKDTIAKYDTGQFGMGCLLARRLTEAGARFIEVATEYVPFKGWDAHEDGHGRVREMKQVIDRPIAQLILDLEERGLLDRTLVVLASEFSRDMMIEGAPGSTAKDTSRAKTDVIKEPKHYGLHRHFTGSGSVLLFGGGMKRGFVYGKTADDRPLISVENPVGIRDLHATILTALGISPAAGFEVERRPFYVTEDGKGRPVSALFASS